MSRILTLARKQSRGVLPDYHNNAGALIPIADHCGTVARADKKKMAIRDLYIEWASTCSGGGFSLRLKDVNGVIALVAAISVNDGHYGAGSLLPCARKAQRIDECFHWRRCNFIYVPRHFVVPILTSSSSVCSIPTILNSSTSSK